MSQGLGAGPSLRALSLKVGVLVQLLGLFVLLFWLPATGLGSVAGVLLACSAAVIVAEVVLLVALCLWLRGRLFRLW